MRKFFLAALFLVLFASVSWAVIEKDSLDIYAVTTKGEGLVADLTLEIEPGTGKIWSAVTPLVGTTTQNAERTAIKVAKNFYSNTDKYDYKFTISSVASVVEGPSAGAAMTLLTVSMLLDKKLPDTVSITGTIKEDGTIGPVGGVFEKTKEAASTGKKLFLIPRGEAIQTIKLEEGVRSVNLLEYAPETWGIKVVEVSNIEEAIGLAFTAVGDIDVNTTASNPIPDFIPDKVQLPSHLGSFKILTSNYIDETRQITSEARNGLSSTLLEDPEVISFLLEVLNDSEQTVSRAEILNEQNYMYSAANFAFLARVNAIIVKEVSNNPSLLEENSTALDLRLAELQRELNNFENDLSGNIPKEGAEWFASAQQRFTYARITLEKIRSEQTLVIDGSEEDRLQNTLARLQDYAFAVAWLDVSKDFYNLSIESNGLVTRSEEFKDSSDSILIDAENGLSVLEEDGERDDITRRVNASKNEKLFGWYEASLFDAASAKALVESEIDSKDKTQDELKKMLQEKISEVEKEIADSNVSVGWAVLFLDHAKFFLASAEYYSEQGFSISATNNLKSGVSLAYLAEEIFDTSSKVNSYYLEQSIVGTAVPVSTVSDPVPVEDDFLLVGILLFSLVFSLVLLLVLIGVIASHKHRKFSIEKESLHLKRLIKDVDIKLLKGEINAEKHANLKDKYMQELSFLEAERKEKAMHVIAIDDYSTEINSYTEKLHDLKKYLNTKVISEVEFKQKSREYLSKLIDLKEKLEAELGALSKQKVLLKNINLDSIANKSNLPVIVGKESLVNVKPVRSFKKPVKPKLVLKPIVKNVTKPVVKPKKLTKIKKVTKKPVTKKLKKI
ncbi:MAG: S16 family serine protease [Candidatus Diapherotrites archaeon]